MYALKKTRHYYGPRDESALVPDPLDPRRLLTFHSKKAAQAFIDAENECNYYLAHNEHSRPTYKIVRAPKPKH